MYLSSFSRYQEGSIVWEIILPNIFIYLSGKKKLKFLLKQIQ